MNASFGQNERTRLLAPGRQRLLDSDCTLLDSFRLAKNRSIERRDERIERID